MRADIVLFWEDVRGNTREFGLLNIYGADFNQLADKARSQAREELVIHQKTWNGVDPRVTSIRVTSHGVE